MREKEWEGSRGRWNVIGGGGGERGIGGPRGIADGGPRGIIVGACELGGEIGIPLGGEVNRSSVTSSSASSRENGTLRQPLLRWPSVGMYLASNGPISALCINGMPIPSVPVSWRVPPSPESDGARVDGAYSFVR